MDNLIFEQYQYLIECNNDEISILANTSAFIMQTFEDISWAGYYILKNNELVLGPFQGKVACTNIPLQKGVCGQAASTQKTIIVENVHEFSGHIACDSASNSEIVIPIMICDQLYGVLDLDSTSLSRFGKKDQIIFEQIVQRLVQQLKKS